MPRFIEFELLHDTALFTPLQMQPRAILSLVMTCWARWLRAHFVSFPRLLRERRLGVVVVGNRIDYLRPHGFFDGEALSVRAHVEVRAGGKLLGVEVGLSSGGAPVVHTSTLVRPLAIEDPESLSAVPCDVPGDVLATFQPDEVNSSPTERHVETWSKRLRDGGTVLHRREDTLVLHRHACEVADQWSYMEVPCLTGASREALSMEHAADLRAGRARPLRSIDIELRRPFYVFDRVVIATAAVRLGSELVFEHELRSEKGDVRGVVIEVIETA